MLHHFLILHPQGGRHYSPIPQVHFILIVQHVMVDHMILHRRVVIVVVLVTLAVRTAIQLMGHQSQRVQIERLYQSSPCGQRHHVRVKQRNKAGCRKARF